MKSRSFCVARCFDVARHRGFRAVRRAQGRRARGSGAEAEAQTSFDAMKSLAGNWEGPVKTDTPAKANVRQQTVARLDACDVAGKRLVHEFQEAGTPLDRQSTTIRSRCCMWTLTQIGSR